MSFPTLWRLPVYLVYLGASPCLSWQGQLFLLSFWIGFLLLSRRKRAFKIFGQLWGLWGSIALLALFFTPGVAIFPSWGQGSPTWAGLELAITQLLWLSHAFFWFMVVWYGRPWSEIVAVLYWWLRWLPGVAHAAFWGRLYLTIWYMEHLLQNPPSVFGRHTRWRDLWQQAKPPQTWTLTFPSVPPFVQWFKLAGMLLGIVLGMCFL